MIAEGISQSLIAFFTYVLTILVILRIMRKTEPTIVVLISASAIYGFSIALAMVANQHVNFWYFSISYWFLVLSFLLAFGAVYKSLSLRMLLVLLEKPNRAHSTQSFREEYIFGDSFDNRLQLIIDQGLAKRREQNEFELTSRGANWAASLVKLQRLFGIMRSG